jgi:hypothetical protein
VVFSCFSDITQALLRPSTAKPEKKTKSETPYVLEQRRKAELSAQRSSLIEAARGNGGDRSKLSSHSKAPPPPSPKRRDRKRKEEVVQRLIFDVRDNISAERSKTQSNDLHSLISRASAAYKQVAALPRSDLNLVVYRNCSFDAMFMCSIYHLVLVYLTVEFWDRMLLQQLQVKLGRIQAQQTFS